jgi:hypothetical protein
MNEIWVFKDH